MIAEHSRNTVFFFQKNCKFFDEKTVNYEFLLNYA